MSSLNPVLAVSDFSGVCGKSRTLLSEAHDLVHFISLLQREVLKVEDEKMSVQVLGVTKQHWK